MNNLAVYMDGMYMVYRGMHKKVAELCFEDEGGVVYTGILFSFLRDLLALKRRYSEARYWAVCWDKYNVAKLYRKQISDKYKTGRGSSKELKDKIGFHKQIDVLKQILLNISIDQYESDEYEADDLLCSLSRQLPYNSVIVSQDKDLYQVLDTSVLYNFSVEKTSAWLMEQYGVTPKEWVYVQALAGDNVDRVDGLCGVGFKTASKLVRCLGFDEVLRELTLSDRESVCEALKLVTLCDCVLLEPIVGKYNRDALLEYFSTYRLYSFYPEQFM